MKTSEQVLEWQAEARTEGRAEGQAAAMTRILAVWFGVVPPDLTATLATAGLDRLSALFESAATVPTLADFRRDAGL